MSRTAAGPPRVPGVLTPTAVDQLRFLWWTEIGFIHGTVRGTWRERITSLGLAVFWWPALLLTVPMKLAQARAVNRVQYMSPERDAVLVVTVDGDGQWNIEDHVSRRPGHGQGRRLRDLVVGPVLQGADDAGATIAVTAANQRLAQIYMTQLEGMTTVGPRGRGILLQRLPR